VRLLRRRQVPDEVRAVVLEPGDRRVAWALTDDQQPVVATERGLVLPGRDRLDWADVERAVWQRPLLTVVESAQVAGTGRTTSLQLRETGDDRLVDVVRAGVTTSVAWSTHVRLQPAGGVRVVGRRRPGRETFDWQLVYDPGTDLDDPVVRAQAEQAALRAQRTVG
jgi:hypothetical protein